MSKIKVLIVDDSPSMRGILRALFTKEPDIEVVGTAGDAHEARAAIKALNPDVMTLDVEMPRMSGLEFLEKVMRLRPMPVIMVSSLTAKGTAAAVESLSLGAFDCVAKPSTNDQRSLDALPNIVRAAVNCPARPAHGPTEKRSIRGALSQTDRPIVVGSSTGGVEALEAVFSSFDHNCPPTLVVQHMPPGFTKSLARRLDKNLMPRVLEAQDGMAIEGGTIYLAPGGDRHMSVRTGLRPLIGLRPGAKVSGHQPSVDVLFESAKKVWGRDCVGVILTGMGEDGARGLKALRDAGAATIAQDEASSVVFGMPQAALRLGAVDELTPLSWIAGAVARASSRSQEQRKTA